MICRKLVPFDVVCIEFDDKKHILCRSRHVHPTTLQQLNDYWMNNTAFRKQTANDSRETTWRYRKKDVGGNVYLRVCGIPHFNGLAEALCTQTHVESWWSLPMYFWCHMHAGLRWTTTFIICISNVTKAYWFLANLNFTACISDITCAC